MSKPPEAVTLTDKGVNFAVECVLVGRTTDLQKRRGGVSYRCPFCGEENSLSLDDLRVPLKGLGGVLAYAAFAKDMEQVGKEKDFLGYLIRRGKVISKYKHEESFSKMRSEASKVAGFKCSLCERLVDFAISAEAAEKIDLPELTYGESGKLTSEMIPKELPFEVYGSDSPQKVLSLYRSLSLIETAERLPIDFKRRKKLLHRLDWRGSDKTLGGMPYTDPSGKSPEENSKEFLQTIENIRRDIKALGDSEKIKEGLSTLLVGRFKTDSLCEIGSKIISDAVAGLGEPAKKKLKRMLLENLFWLSTEVERAVARAEIDSSEFEPRLPTFEEAEAIAKETGEAVEYRVEKDEEAEEAE